MSFRFGVLGAGRISNKFCDAVARIEGAEVVAIASKSMDRAKSFATANAIPAAYDDYVAMIEEMKPDAVYIGVTTNAHYELVMLCLELGVPILCEKPMFTDMEQAKTALAKAAEKKVFLMEAMWSRFLPAVKKAKQWVEEGKIGTPTYSNLGISNLMNKDPQDRFYSAALGGGSAYDLGVYGYDITTFVLGDIPIDQVEEYSIWSETGVDIENLVVMRYPDTIATFESSFISVLDERLIVCGDAGMLIVPHSHYATEAFLYDSQRTLVEHFKDEETVNGFVYEILEAMQCIREGKLESSVITHRDTIASTLLYDKVNAHRPKHLPA
ncbi:MAG: Gfo/Idh/MocA family oxidoreductase [Lachnospiraceae bacterium]|nr:Gfo/Idh/MocA family oxidoreductase [Lachnospiraceae bacterium]